MAKRLKTILKELRAVMFMLILEKLSENENKAYLISEEDELYEYIIKNVNKLPKKVIKQEKSFLRMIDNLIDHFAEGEDYEKCAVLDKIIINWEKIKKKNAG